MRSHAYFLLLYLRIRFPPEILCLSVSVGATVRVYSRDMCVCVCYGRMEGGTRTREGKYVLQQW